MNTLLDKQTESEYPTLRRKYLKYLSTQRNLYVRLKYLTYLSLRLTLGTILFTVVLFSATVRLVARTACHSYVSKQENKQ
jgi:hypothetical protein